MLIIKREKAWQVPQQPIAIKTQLSNKTAWNDSPLGQSIWG